MASYAAISVIANTIRLLLANSAPPGQFAGADFKLLGTQDFATTGHAPTLGISIYMYRLDFNTNRRNLPPRVTPDGHRFRPSTPVDLHFLITAWATPAEVQLDLLAWAIRTLQDTPQLPAGVLNRFAGDRPEPVFFDTEAVELVGEVLSPQDLMNLWGNTLANQQPSVSYIARQVLIDSETPLPDGGLVQMRQFNLATP